MKFIFLFLSIVVSSPVWGQEIKPKKGDSQIVVKSTYSLQKIGELLLTNGFEIDKIDTALKYLTTAARPIPKINGEYYLKIIQKQNMLVITGLSRLNFTATLAGVMPTKGAYEAATYTKSRSDNRRVFDEAFKVAGILGKVERTE